MRKSSTYIGVKDDESGREIKIAIPEWAKAMQSMRIDLLSQHFDNSKAAMIDGVLLNQCEQFIRLYGEPIADRLLLIVSTVADDDP